jgi:site-specific recombinase XerD
MPVRRHDSRHNPNLSTAGTGETVTMLAVTPSGREAVREFQQKAISDSTRRGYETDWAAFTSWCDQVGADSLPADPELVSTYLAMAANMVDENGDLYYAPGTLKRWLWSINKAHFVAGFAKPGSHPDVSTTMAGIKRVRARPADRKAPLLLGDLKRVFGEIDLNSWPHGVIGQRDTTMLLFGFAGAYRRSELASLQLRDVRIHPEDGLHVLLRSSKTDQESVGVVKGLPFGANPVTCPPCAFVRWVRILAAAGEGRPALIRVLMTVDITRHVCREPLPELLRVDGRLPVFRPVMKNGAVTDRPISGNVVNDVVQRRVAAAGMDAPAYGAHSLRAGFVTQSFRAGATHHEIMRQTGHKGVETLEIYSRETDPLRHNAVTRLGL